MKFFFTKKYESITKKGGFTLLETLVAISILVIAITATFSAAQNGLSSALDVRDQITAFYLAQEAVEMVRNTRDSNSIERAENPAAIPAISWIKGLAENLSDPCAFGKVCIVDATNNVFTACPTGSGSCPNMRKDSTAGLYGYNGSWNTTSFNREITLSPVNPTELVVEVTVTWGRSTTRSFTVNEVLRDWQ
jgi:prepilin-type N-terminal cleavage/methylation domain-containing protein